MCDIIHYSTPGITSPTILQMIINRSDTRRKYKTHFLVLYTKEAKIVIWLSSHMIYNKEF